NRGQARIRKIRRRVRRETRLPSARVFYRRPRHKRSRSLLGYKGDTGSARPLRRARYRLPPARRNGSQKESGRGGIRPRRGALVDGDERREDIHRHRRRKAVPDEIRSIAEVRPQPLLHLRKGYPLPFRVVLGLVPVYVAYV